MEKGIEIPKFTLRERIGILLKGEVDLPKTGEIRPKTSWFKEARQRIDSALLRRRLPLRNNDGSMNWPNYFAWSTGLARPITKKDVFPEGHEGLSPKDIDRILTNFINEYSLTSENRHLATGFDPNEFPEVIDSDFQHLAKRINQVPFIRTAMSCAGHAEETTGLIDSYMGFVVDPNDPNTGSFHEKIKDLEKRYAAKNIKIQISDMWQEQPVVQMFTVKLVISPPDEWHQEDTDLTPDEQLFEIQQDHIHLWQSGKNQLGFTEYPAKRSDTAFMSKYRRAKSWGKSSQCKAIRDQFWQEIGQIADIFKQGEH